MTIPLLTILALILLLVVLYIVSFNRLNQRKNQIDNAFSSLDALFIKRSELIPNLIGLVKEYMRFEQETLDKITSLRVPANKNAEAYQHDGEAEKVLKQVMIQLENYPELKASSQFTQVQYSLNECEEQIAAGRRYLSASITVFNDAVASFPSNIVAGMIGMKKHEWQRATDSQRQNISTEELFRK